MTDSDFALTIEIGQSASTGYRIACMFVSPEALTKVRGIGPILSKRIWRRFNSRRNVFARTCYLKEIKKINGIGNGIIKHLKEFISKNDGEIFE
eukprot:UN01156